MTACGEEKLLSGPLKFMEIQDTPSGTHGPAFDPDTDVAHKEILEIDATAPGVIGLEVPVIFPRISCENVGTPKANVKFSVGVPLRARWRSSHLFNFFPGIANPGKGGRSDGTTP